MLTAEWASYCAGVRLGWGWHSGSGCVILCHPGPLGAAWMAHLAGFGPPWQVAFYSGGQYCLGAKVLPDPRRHGMERAGGISPTLGPPHRLSQEGHRTTLA